ncbi:MAG TPA: TMEM175 family protein [Mizugakiibacter sp.]
MHDAPPRDERGFRIRSTQPTRIDAFVDAAFAFAVTLLVVSVGSVPESMPQLLDAMRGIPAFALSFLAIARVWLTHRQWSRRYALEDAYTTRLNLGLVLVVLLYVYPLRLISALALSSISDGVLAERALQTLQGAGELRVLYATFAVGYAVVAIILALLHRHALRCADAVGLSAVERLRTRTTAQLWTAMAAIALLSLLLAVFVPMGRAQPLPLDSLPGLAYLLVFVARAVLVRRERAALAALAEDATA